MPRLSASKRFLVPFLVMLLLQTGARAHEDLEIRIAELTGQFAQSGDAAILVRRADLHRRHRDWDLAAKDLDRAAALGVPGKTIRLARATLLLDRDQADQALKVLGKLDSVPARFLRARALAHLEQTDQASAAFVEAIAACDPPLPDHYLEHARLLAGTKPARLAEALRVLDRGLKRLGPIISLHEEAFRLERESDPAAALRRVRQINQKDTPSNPRWLVREVELRVDLGPPDQATAALATARKKLETLPFRRKSTPAIRALIARLDAQEKKLASERLREEKGPAPKTATPTE